MQMGNLFEKELDKIINSFRENNRIYIIIYQFISLPVHVGFDPVQLLDVWQVLLDDELREYPTSHEKEAMVPTG